MVLNRCTCTTTHTWSSENDVNKFDSTTTFVTPATELYIDTPTSPENQGVRSEDETFEKSATTSVKHIAAI